jgi:hypothetical protein
MSEHAIRNQPVRLGLTAKILIGLGLGVMTGLFFGESAAALQIVADAYIRLMQMVVLPYLAIALMAGLGQLEANQAKLLALRGGALLLLFWAISVLTIFLMSLTFPEWQAGSFFSSALVEPRKAFNFVELYIPANPFHALANSIVPAVVFFSAAVGVALIGVEDKEQLIRGLETFLAALSRLTRFLVGLTPVGVFAIGAVAAGTMTLTEFARLQAYFVPLYLSGAVADVLGSACPGCHADALQIQRHTGGIQGCPAHRFPDAKSLYRDPDTHRPEQPAPGKVRRADQGLGQAGRGHCPGHLQLPNRRQAAHASFRAVYGLAKRCCA